MRKGLVTLGVVALVLAVSSSFAEAPLLSCLPDIVISDVEQNSQTVDSNLFIFSDAIDLDEYVNDADTPTTALRWSFIESGSQTIEINGILSNPAVDTLDPGVDDIRAVSNMASFKNVAWYGTGQSVGATTEVMIEMYVSDVTTVTHQTIKVTTVDTGPTSPTVGPGDEVARAVQANYGFTVGAEGWVWFEQTNQWIAAAPHTASGGKLNITEPAVHTLIIFGAYESPKDPTVAVKPKLGCIMRARYQIAASGVASPTASPGFRLRGATVHVSNAGGTWEPNFASEDYNSLDQVQYGTINFIMGSGDFDSRVPGTGQEYALLVFPRQVSEMLLSTDPTEPVINYFSCDLLDLEGMTETDAGTLEIDSVVIDGIDRPELGAGTAVPELSFTGTDFSSGWTTGKKGLPPGTLNDVGLVASADATGLTITVAPGNEFFEAFCEKTAGVSLTPGRYYRLAFFVTSSEAPGGDEGPKVRCNLDSENFVYNALKELQGGSLLARLTSTPSLMELWVVAPSQKGATGLTEGMKPKFSSYLGANVASWPFNRTVSGTVKVTAIQTEVFDF